MRCSSWRARFCSRSGSDTRSRRSSPSGCRSRGDSSRRTKRRRRTRDREMEMALTLPAQFIAGTTTKGSAPQKPMNEAQFEAFYRKTAGGLWSYLYRLVGNAATADDLLQKTFFRYLRSNPALSGEEHMRRYLFRTATNLALDHFRETKRERN